MEQDVNEFIEYLERFARRTKIEAILTSFGNYLLSEERAESVSDLNRNSVTHADIENWKAKQG